MHNMITRDDKAAFWRAHLEAWRCSGLTGAAYCERHGLIVHRFGYWRRRLEGEASAVGEFVPVRLRSGGTVRLCLPNGVVLECGEGTDSHWLVQLAAGLGAVR